MIDPEVASLTIDASIQAYYAYDEHNPPRCTDAGMTCPTGYDLVGCWSGVDTAFSWFTQVECFGVVFRSETAPYTYVYAFRGTYSILDAFEDAAFWHLDPFVPHDHGVRATQPGGQPPAGGAHVASGFWGIYATALRSTPSVQPLACALASKDGVCENKALPVPTDGETLDSGRPDPSTVCSFWVWEPSARQDG